MYFLLPWEGGCNSPQIQVRLRPEDCMSSCTDTPPFAHATREVSKLSDIVVLLEQDYAQHVWHIDLFSRSSTSTCSFFSGAVGNVPPGSSFAASPGPSAAS